MQNYVRASNSMGPLRYYDTPCPQCGGTGCNYCHRNGFIRNITPSDPFYQTHILDTQEQRKSKGAIVCSKCGCFCATEQEGK
jgi:hypothetical protein